MKIYRGSYVNKARGLQLPNAWNKLYRDDGVHRFSALIFGESVEVVDAKE